MESDSDGPSVNGLLEIPGVAVLFFCSEVEIDGFEEFVGSFVAGVGGGRVEDGISKNWPDDDGSNFLTGKREGVPNEVPEGWPNTAVSGLVPRAPEGVPNEVLKGLGPSVEVMKGLAVGGFDFVERPMSSAEFCDGSEKGFEGLD